MIVRAATIDDVAALAAVSVAAGHAGGDDPTYLRLILDTGTVRVVDGPDGVVVGWGAVRDTPLGSMLTDLFVRPEQHGRGIGAAVLRALWPDPDAAGRFTFGSQHASALPLYARAGLLPTWPLLYLSGSTHALDRSPLSVDDVPVEVAAAADGALSGATRRHDYEFWRSRPARTVVVRDGDQLVGAGVLRPGQVVHLACSDPNAAAPALGAVLHAVGGTVSIQLPGPHPGTIPLLRAGFRVTDFDHAMSTPGLELPTTWAYSPGLA